MSNAMLAEIQSESLQCLLGAVNAETSPPGSSGIPALDAHLFSGSHYHPSELSSFNRGDIIEIQGPPASGKTHLLYHLVITCIIPSEYNGIVIGGWSQAAVIVDTDGTFNAQRLSKLILSRLKRILVSADSDTEMVEDLNENILVMCEACLKKVHIFRPTSSTQLAATLAHLPSYHANQILDDEIGIIAVDSISSFYWPDRFTVEQTRGETVVVNPLTRVLDALGKLRASYSPVIILINWAINPLTKPTSTSGPTTNWKQHLFPFPMLSPNAQSNTDSLGVSTTIPVLTHHITLSYAFIGPFASDISIVDALEQDAKYRNKIVSMGEVTGVVRSSGNNGVGRFSFYIKDEDITVNSNEA